MTVLAIDQGTTSTCALVLERSGMATITKVIEHEQIYPQSKWVEHDPEELIRNIQACIDSSCLQFSDISAIGIDNQGESCLAWHAETKQALLPVIVWQDSRTQNHIDQLKSDGVEELVLKQSGLPLDANFSASKLAWLVNNNDEVQLAFKQGELRIELLKLASYGFIFITKRAKRGDVCFYNDYKNFFLRLWGKRYEKTVCLPISLL